MTILGILILVLFASPTVVGTPAAGTFEAYSKATITGTSTLDGHNALVVMEHPQVDAPLTLKATRMVLTYHESSFVVTSGQLPVGTSRAKGPAQNYTYAFDGPTVSMTTLGENAFLGFLPPPSLTNPLGVRWESSGEAVVTREGPTLVTSENASVASPSHEVGFFFTYEYPRDHVLVYMQDGRLTLSGDLRIYLWDTLATVTSRGRTHEFPTGESVANETPLAFDRERNWITATLENASATWEVPASGLALRLDAMAGTTHGSVSIARARGVLHALGVTLETDGIAPVTVLGTLDLGARPAASSARGSFLALALSGEVAQTSLGTLPAAADPLVSLPLPGAPAGLLWLIVVGSLVASYAGWRFARRTPLLRGGERNDEVEVCLSQVRTWERLGIPWVSPWFIVRAYSRLLSGVPAMNLVAHRHDRAVWLARLRRWEAALRDMEIVTALSPENGDAHYDLARLLSQGRPEEADRALNHLEIALRLEPGLRNHVQNEPSFRTLRNHPRFLFVSKGWDTSLPSGPAFMSGGVGAN